MEKRLYDNNYFIEQLEKGREIKACFMVHNAYWPFLEKINKRYSNVSIDIFGGSINYYLRNKDADWDFIILSSSFMFSFGEFTKLGQIAMLNSNKYHKRVTVGYLSYIPFEERMNDDVHMNLNILSFKSENKYQEIIPISVDSADIFSEDPLSMLDIVSLKHDELENQKVMIKK